MLFSDLLLNSHCKEIPKYLFRGDADEKNVRKIKEYRRGALLTDLASGGQGNVVFWEPLERLIQGHISPGWPKTHFLSFSSSHETACKYAIGSNHSGLSPTIDSDFDAMIVKLDTEIFSKVKNLSDGIWECHYDFKLDKRLYGDTPHDKYLIHGRKISNFSRDRAPYRVLLINPVMALSCCGHSGLCKEEAMEKSKVDSEWLVWPADIGPSLNGEFMAQLEISCVERFELYNRI